MSEPDFTEGPPDPYRDGYEAGRTEGAAAERARLGRELANLQPGFTGEGCRICVYKTPCARCRLIVECLRPTTPSGTGER